MSDRTILHCDCNSFFASVETVLDPDLAKVPMAVVGDPNMRHGIILAKNELAKKRGVQTAETIWKAKAKCPNLVCVPPHMEKYAEYSRKCNEIYKRYTDLVEPFGIDESWLDVTDSRNLFGSGEQIANELREIVKNELGITISVGVSFNKVFAKLGSDYKKPDATTVITRDEGKKIVWPLPVADLLFVGRRTVPILEDLNIRTIGDLAKFSRDALIKKLGQLGGVIHDYANGKDESPVNPISEDEKSVGNGSTFEKDISSYDELLPRVVKLADSVGLRLRKKGFKAGTISVAIKSPDFKIVQHQRKVDSTNITKDITKIAMELIKARWQEGKPIRAVTITASNLTSGNAMMQMSFFDEDKEKIKDEKLQEMIDKLNEKFGPGTVNFGSHK